MDLITLHILHEQMSTAALESLYPYLKKAVEDDLEGGQVLIEITNLRNQVFCKLQHAGVEMLRGN